MIVRVSREEICGLLSKELKRKVKDFVITNAEPPLIGRAVRAAVHNPLDNDLKIGNIKALRNLATMMNIPMTLMEGKYALEHWVEWIGFVDAHNRFPDGGYGSGEGFGILR